MIYWSTTLWAIEWAMMDHAIPAKVGSSRNRHRTLSILSLAVFDAWMACSRRPPCIYMASSRDRINPVHFHDWIHPNIVCSRFSVRGSWIDCFSSCLGIIPVWPLHACISGSFTGPWPEEVGWRFFFSRPCLFAIPWNLGICTIGTCAESHLSVDHIDLGNDRLHIFEHT